MSAVEGLEVTVATLDLDTALGTIDGRAIAAADPAGGMTAATTADKFRAQLLSEDGDGTFTVTLGTDDLASAALAAAEALTIAVPSGGVGVCTAVVKQDGSVSDLSLAVRGNVAADYASADVS